MLQSQFRPKANMNQRINDEVKKDLMRRRSRNIGRRKQDTMHRLNESQPPCKEVRDACKKHSQTPYQTGTSILTSYYEEDRIERIRTRIRVFARSQLDRHFFVLVKMLLVPIHPDMPPVVRAEVKGRKQAWLACKQPYGPQGFDDI